MNAEEIIFEAIVSDTAFLKKIIDGMGEIEAMKRLEMLCAQYSKNIRKDVSGDEFIEYCNSAAREIKEKLEE